MPIQSEPVVHIKDRMIRTASELFHEEGVKFTTPDDIVKASGSTMNQFYHYFHNMEIALRLCRVLVGRGLAAS